MATKIMSADRIEALNRTACAKVRIAHEAMDDPAHRDVLYYGLQAVARERGLVLARYAGGDPDKFGTSEGPQCEVYRDPHTNTFVNLWVEGDALGFDGQVDLDD